MPGRNRRQGMPQPVPNVEMESGVRQELPGVPGGAHPVEPRRAATIAEVLLAEVSRA